MNSKIQNKAPLPRTSGGGAFCCFKNDYQQINYVKQSISKRSFRDLVGVRRDSVKEECALPQWLSHGHILHSDIFQDMVPNRPARIAH
jgi:hypothetical protein